MLAQRVEIRQAAGMHTILILGAAVWPEGPSPTLRRRTLHAARLWHAQPDAALIPCGGLGQHPPTEAAAMRDLLLGAGIAADAITLEDQSTTTFENIRNAARLITGRSVTIVTDPYHASRALMVARHFGLDACADCPLSEIGQSRHLLREALARIGYRVKLRQTPRDPHKA